MTASTTSIKIESEKIYERLRDYQDQPSNIKRILFIHLNIEIEEEREVIYSMLLQLEFISSGGSFGHLSCAERLDLLFAFDLLSRQIEDWLNPGSEREDFFNYAELIRELLYDYQKTN